MKQSRPDPHAPPPFHPVAAEGGVMARPAMDGDPYKALDDLMVVVEALCPQWPERETFTGTEEFRL